MKICVGMCKASMPKGCNLDVFREQFKVQRMVWIGRGLEDHLFPSPLPWARTPPSITMGTPVWLCPTAGVNTQSFIALRTLDEQPRESWLVVGPLFDQSWFGLWSGNVWLNQSQESCTWLLTKFNSANCKLNNLGCKLPLRASSPTIKLTLPSSNVGIVTQESRISNSYNTQRVLVLLFHSSVDIKMKE